MIKSVTFTHFRKHTNATFDLGPGLIALRGANESGKSTLLEGIGYALYGSSALRTTLDEAVTWGEDARRLKVEVVVTHNGKDYTFTRGKSGAEVVVDGRVYVTGQKDTAEFASQIMGADAGMAKNLMFAAQGDLRGTLEGGPKATAQIIESLADLDLFDRILEAASERLTTGSPEIFNSKIESLKAELERMEIVSQPDTEQHQAASEALSHRLMTMTGELEGKDKDLQARLATLSDMQEKRSRVASINEKLEYITTQKAAVESRLAEAEAKTFPDNLDERETRLKEEVASASKAEDRWHAYQAFLNYEAPEQFKGPEDELAQEIQNMDTLTDKARDRKSDNRAKMASLKAQIVSSSVCGLCNEDVSKFPGVAEKNAKLEAEISAIQASDAEGDEWIVELQERRAELVKFKAAQDKLLRLYRIIAEYVELDESNVPNTMTWKGVPPTEPETDPTPLLAQVQKDIRERDANKAQIAALTEQVQSLKAEAEKLADEVSRVESPSEAEYEAARDSYTKMATEVATLESQRDAAKDELNELVRVHKEAVQAWERNREVRESIEKSIKENEEAIKTVAFNTALVKKIRATRPIVSNKLWSMVLTGVSTLFSQVRGEKSVVERTANGFTVNGSPITSLSGSSMDLLGTATRVALVRTFLPACPILIVDEPAQGCDASRTASLLGFLAGCGFSQIIMATHDPLSETFADSVINL